MSRVLRRVVVAVAVSLVVAFLSLAGLFAGSTRSTLVVGAKGFTESRLLAHLMAEAIRHHTGLSVEVRELGSTTLCFQGLRRGAIHLYPEYTGTLLVEILRMPSRANPAETYALVSHSAQERYAQAVLPTFGFNNTYVLAMPEATAERLGIRRISDLTGFLHLKAGFTSEFLQRPDGYPGLARHYGLNFRSTPVDLAPGHMYGAVQAGHVDLISAFSTDYRLQQFNLRTLEDDREFFPAYQAFPLLQKSTISRWPGVETALMGLSGKLTEGTMRELNRQVDQQKLPVFSVARSYYYTQLARNPKERP